MVIKINRKKFHAAYKNEASFRGALEASENNLGDSDLIYHIGRARDEAADVEIQLRHDKPRTREEVCKLLDAYDNIRDAEILDALGEQGLLIVRFVRHIYGLSFGQANVLSESIAYRYVPELLEDEPLCSLAHPVVRNRKLYADLMDDLAFSITRESSKRSVADYLTGLLYTLASRHFIDDSTVEGYTDLVRPWYLATTSLLHPLDKNIQEVVCQ